MPLVYFIQSPMEKEIKIKTVDGHHIYGRMTGSARQPLFVVVHGLPGSMDEDFYINATRWFAKRGYATFRFNLYGAEKDARQLTETTLETHASDIDTIVRYFRAKKFKNIVLAGHSYAGPAIFLSKERGFDSAVLWDPSYKVSFTKTEKGFPPVKYLKEIKGYVMRWGVNFVIGKAMAEEADRLDWDALAKDFYVPLKIVVAGKGYLVSGARKYFKVAAGPKELTIMKAATHYFNDTEGMREEVFTVSDDWFKKFHHK